MPTRSEIRREVADRLGKFEQFEASGGSTTTITSDDPIIMGAEDFPPTDSFDNWWVLPVSGTNAGEARRILRNSAGFDPENGTITIPGTTPWASAMADGDDVELYGALPPQVIDRCLNRALRRMAGPVRFPLTLIPDGDMESSGMTSWTAQGTATAMKTTAAGNITNGAQALLVSRTDGTNARVRSAAIPVVEAGQYNVWVDVRNLTPGASAVLRAISVQDPTEALDSETWDEGVEGTLGIAFAAPADTQQVYVEVGIDGGSTSASGAFDNAIMLEQGRVLYDIPTYIGHPPSQMRAVYRVGAPSSTGLHIRNRDLLEVGEWAVVSDVGANVPYRIRVGQAGVQVAPSPYWCVGLKRFTRLTSDSASTDAALDWVTAGAMRQCYLRLRNRAGTQDARIWTVRVNEASREFGRLSKQYVPPKRRRTPTGPRFGNI